MASADVQNVDSYVAFKRNELLQFIREVLSKKENYEEKDDLFKQHLQHDLSEYISQYETKIKWVFERHEESSNNNTYLRDVKESDERIRERVENKINEALKKEYVPPPKELIQQKQREWIKEARNKEREYYKTPEGRQFKTQEASRKQQRYQNKIDPLIKKMRDGEDFSEELRELNEKIAKSDPSDKKIIDRHERKLREIGDAQIRKENEKYDKIREETKRMFEQRPRKYPSNEEEFTKTMKQIDENEKGAIRPIQIRTDDSIIYMKTDYIRSGKLPDLFEESPEESPNEPTQEEPTLSPTPVPVVEAKPEPKLEDDNLYMHSILHQKVSVPFTHIGNNMEYFFKRYAIKHIEGKCRKEGFIRPNSIKVVSFSTGLLQADNVVYDVIYSADVCFPCEDMIIKCKIVNITKIGIRAIISEVHNPIVLFISREHNANKNFEDYEEGNRINIKVIGHRFELNDEYISVIGEII